MLVTNKDTFLLNGLILEPNSWCSAATDQLLGEPLNRFMLDT